VLIRFAHLAVTNAFAAMRLLPRSDRDKDIEILTLRHQLTVLQRNLDDHTVSFTPADRAFLAALLNSLPRGVMQQLQLLVSSDTVVSADYYVRTGEGPIMAGGFKGWLQHSLVDGVLWCQGSLVCRVSWCVGIVVRRGR
jgi:hypothetical protein